MTYILLSIVLFSFNNILWKKNLQHTTILFLVSYRASITALLSLGIAFYLEYFKSITPIQFLHVSIGSIFGVIGLLSMLSVIKKASLHWLGVYNLLGILFTTLYLLVIEKIEFKYSIIGVFFIIIGFIFYILSTKNKSIKMKISQHILLLLMTISFSCSSIIHWKNLSLEIPTLVILSNQELIVFITSFLLGILCKREDFNISYYRNYFSKIIFMAIIIFFALLCSFLGLKQTDPFLSSLLFLASPLTTIVLNIIFFKEHLSKQNLLALLLMITGAFILHYISI